MDNILNINFDVKNLSQEELSEARKTIIKNYISVERQKTTAKKLNQDTQYLDKQKKYLNRLLYKVTVQQSILERDSC